MSSHYFDAVADHYLNDISKGITGWLRRKEAKILLTRLDPRPGDSILDAGSGPGFYSKLILSSGCKLKAVDASVKMVEQARKEGIDCIQADLQTLELREKFTKVLCAGVLEFCYDSKGVIQRLAVHLESGGLLVLLIPHRSLSGLLYKIFHKFHGVSLQLFHLQELHESLENLGFRIVDEVKATPMSTVLTAVKLDGQRRTLKM